MKIRDLVIACVLLASPALSQTQPVWSTVPRIEYGQGVPEAKWCTASQSGTIYIDTWPQSGLGFHVFYTCDQKTTGVYVWEGPYGAGGGGSTSPGGNPGQVQVNKLGAFGGVTIGGDASLNGSNGAMTVNSTHGTPFAPSATVDTTNAGNITSGVLNQGVIPSTVAQTNISNIYSSGTQDYTNAQHTIPAVTGITSAKPVTCAVGEVYFASDATPGQNLYFCTSSNFWTQMTGGSSPVTLSWASLNSGQWAGLTASQWTSLHN